MKLSELEIHQSAVVQSLGGSGALRRHLLDMGVTPGTEVTLVKRAPMGDPVELELRGYSLTLRLADGETIEVSEPYLRQKKPKAAPAARRPETKHPGHGEMGEEHWREHARSAPPVIPEGKPISFALAGNQNCGKTTLFNQLTGSNQHVGNFPGVTVDRKDGVIRNHPEATVTDLPGIYSLSPYSNEEIVTRSFLIENKPTGIINIVDATNIERNLYLTMQLIDLGIPMVLALNMMDELTGNGGTILVNELEAQLGIPVVPISAAKNQGIDELIQHAIHVARYQETPKRIDYCDQGAGAKSGAVHRCIHAICHLIEDHAQRAELPLRFSAVKLIEGDQPVEAALRLDQNETELLEHAVVEMEQECGMDREAALADVAFQFIGALCQQTVVKPSESKEHARSVAMDRILTGKYTAIPMFLLIMAFVFWMTFGVLGKFLSDGLDAGITVFSDFCDRGLAAYGINEVVRSLVIDGVFAGVGSVLSFLPTIVVLFFFLSILEDSGYMARVAFVMDKLLRRIGLSGRSFVPMLIGFGCSVPAIMASRTLSSERDRKMTIMMTPFMSCSAKLPIYGVFTAAFFPRYQVLVMISLYILGIVVGIVVALIMKHTGFKGEPVPFVMELPNYRFPSPRSVAQLIWEKAKGFIVKAFTIIFVASVLVWFFQTFDTRLNLAQNPSQSLLALLGGLLAPLFRPLGLGDWRMSTALITGFAAKESVISTLTVLLGSTGALKTLFTPWQAYTFLVFTLLYTPCVAAIAAVKRELGRKSAIQIMLFQCVVAWLAALLFATIGRVLGLM